MTVRRDRITGDPTVTDDLDLQGQVTGSVRVETGATLDLHGQIARDLIIEEGATVVLHGQVTGNVNNAGELTVYGVVNGWVRTIHEGSTRVDPAAVVLGGTH